MAGAERPKSEWAVPERLGGLSIDEATSEETGGHVLLAAEAERIVEGLKRFKLEEVGNAAWMAQHASVEKLNQQAHASARDKMDEFVLEALLTFEKIPTLIYDLVLVEAWRESVLPLLFDDIVGEGKDGAEARRRSASMRAYFVLYHEATVVNLLEVVCYHAHALQAAKDSTLDLLDYCARRLVAVQARASEFREAAMAKHEPGMGAKEVADLLQQRTPSEELKCHMRDIEFSASVACIALVRFVCEHCGELSVSSLSRLLTTHDFMLMVVPLVENPPWTRVRKDKTTGKRAWQKLVDGEWATIAHDRLLEVTKLEAQAWLALYHLTMHPEVRKRYGFDAHRKQALLKARRFLNDVLLDQLPVLADMQRFMDELAVVDAPEPTALNQSNHLLMEQIAAQREMVLRGADFVKIAQTQRETIWLNDENDDKDLRALVDVYAGEELDQAKELDLDDLTSTLDDVKGALDGFDLDDIVQDKKLEARDEVRIVDARCGATCFAVPSDLPSKVVQTPNGSFVRQRWQCTAGIEVDSDAQLNVQVARKSREEAQILQADEADAIPSSLESAKKKLWLQFGSVDSGLAVQLQLVLQNADQAPPKYKVAEVYVAFKED